MVFVFVYTKSDDDLYLRNGCYRYLFNRSRWQKVNYFVAYMLQKKYSRLTWQH